MPSSKILVLALLLGTALPGAAQGDAVPTPAQQPLLALADRVLSELSRLRSLPALRPIQRGVMSRDAILARLRERVRQELPPGAIQNEERFLKRFGLIPATMAYEREMFLLLSEQVAGFYDPFRAELYVADWVPEAMQTETLAHELEHALQDQHFQLRNLMRHRAGESDRSVAVSALCEGDGVAIMLDYMLHPTGMDIVRAPDIVSVVRAQIGNMSGQPRLQASPRAVRESLLFPYLDGLSFVRALRIAGGWARVDQAFRAPPESTEQILHPERFLAGDTPERVTIGPVPAIERTHRRTDDDVVGELGWQLFLTEHLPENRRAQVEAAAAGWGGDRAALYVRSVPNGQPETVDDLATVVMTSWDPAAAPDADAEAREFELAMVHAIERRYPTGRVVPVRGATARVVGQSATLVERRGRRTLYLDGIPAGALAAVRDEAWAAAR